MKLFSWGSNSHGQLGIGKDLEQVLSPIEVDCGSIDISSIVFITGGGGHTLLLTKNGLIYVCGNNDSEQLGIVKTQKVFNTFQRLNIPIQIKQVSCGWNFNLAVSAEGVVYGWGSNLYGQLGFSINKIKKVPQPEKLNCVEAARVSAGLRHSFIISKGLTVYSAGCGRKGQLGISNLSISTVDQFTEVPGISDVQSVACGQNTTLILTGNDEMYACGSNKYGELGINPKSCLFSGIFMKIEYEGKKINEIHAGWTHFCAVTVAGDVLCWGRNSYGQLGNSGGDKMLPHPVRIPEVRQFSCGSEHCIALTKDREVVTWGWNEHGNCGNGTTDNIQDPVCVLVDNEVPVLVGCGAAHSFVIVE